MNTSKVRVETSDNPKVRGRQALPSDDVVGCRIESVLLPRPRSWLAQASGLAESTISDAIKRGPSRSDVALKIARALGVSVDWLLSGEGPAPSVDLGAVGRRFTEHLREQLSVAGKGDDLADVQEIDLAYGLGGSFTDDLVTVQTHRFPRAWLESITSTPPSMLTFARGRGDSMQPTIQDGDMVLIDRSQRNVREWDAVWALTIGEMAMIKRVRVRGDRVHILSDNERVPTDDIFHEEINVVGRVIFIGRRI